MNIAQVNAAILAGNFTNDQLNSITDAIKFARHLLISQNKRELRVGQITNRRRFGVNFSIHVLRSLHLKVVSPYVV